MAILHSWRCMAHGEFQSFNQKCPHGCDDTLVSKVLGCSISTGKPKAVAEMVDRKMMDIAAQFGVGDLDIRDGRSSAPNDFNFNETRDQQKLRLAGQTYAIPNDPSECEVRNGEFVNKRDDSAAIGRAGVAGDTNMAQAMKGYFQEAMKKNTHVAAIDNTPLPIPQ